jgi:hypothetical protein
MSSVPGSIGRRMPQAAVLFAAASALSVLQAAHAAHTTRPRFEQVFDVRGEPAATHFEAVYEVGSAEHRVEVWRDGGQRIRRRTDDAAESYAVRTSAGPDFHLSLLDLKRRIRTDIDRDNLYRIGNFTDWFDLGHGLRHPAGSYTIVAAAAPAGAPKPVGACTWYDLAQSGRVTHVCWSAKDRLPLALIGQDGKPLWRVKRVDHRPIPAATFAIPDQGFVRNDANADIERD